MRNDEMQFYTDANAHCSDGMLRIVAEHHPSGVANPDMQWCDGVHSAWCDQVRQPLYTTSSSLQTRQEATGLLTHGQYDARIKIEVAANAWPAWWAVGSTTGTAGSWPQDGEIDMLEYRRGHLFMQLAYAKDPHDHGRPVWSPAPKSDGRGHVTGVGDALRLSETWAASFHEYSMVWTSCCIDMYLDGQLMARAPVESFHAQPHNPYAGDQLLPLILKLNLAVPKQDRWQPWYGSSFEYVQPRWPITMQVDYVRYFAFAVPPPPAVPPFYPMRPPFPPSSSHGSLATTPPTKIGDEEPKPPSPPPVPLSPPSPFPALLSPPLLRPSEQSPLSPSPLLPSPPPLAPPPTLPTPSAFGSVSVGMVAIISLGLASVAASLLIFQWRRKLLAPKRSYSKVTATETSKRQIKSRAELSGARDSFETEDAEEVSSCATQVSEPQQPERESRAPVAETVQPIRGQGDVAVPTDAEPEVDRTQSPRRSARPLPPTSSYTLD